MTVSCVSEVIQLLSLAQHVVTAWLTVFPRSFLFYFFTKYRIYILMVDLVMFVAKVEYLSLSWAVSCALYSF